MIAHQPCLFAWLCVLLWICSSGLAPHCISLHHNPAHAALQTAATFAQHVLLLLLLLLLKCAAVPFEEAGMPQVFSAIVWLAC